MENRTQEIVTPTMAVRSDDTVRRGQISTLLTNRDRLARLLAVLLFGAVALNILLVTVVSGVLNRGIQFVVLDPEGNVILAPGTSFELATELHIRQGLLIASALLSRHAKDFDQPEILQAALSREALAQAESLKAAEAQEFQERSLEQKPHIDRVDAVVKKRGEVEVRATGTLARFGTFQSAPFVESVPFELRLNLQQNANLLTNRRQPTMLRSFTLLYEARK